MDIVLEELTAGLPDTAQMIRVAVRLTAAMILGALIGLERERANKPAGLRTHMLVSLGSALFILIPAQSGLMLGDLTRVIQGITTGIGFLGGGAILKLSDERDVKGLTTAAGIWMTAAIGMAAGLGQLGMAIFGVVLALLILATVARLDEWTQQWKGKRLRGRKNAR